MEPPKKWWHLSDPCRFVRDVLWIMCGSCLGCFWPWELGVQMWKQVRASFSDRFGSCSGRGSFMLWSFTMSSRHFGPIITFQKVESWHSIYPQRSIVLISWYILYLFTESAFGVLTPRPSSSIISQRSITVKQRNSSSTIYFKMIPSYSIIFHHIPSYSIIFHLLFWYSISMEYLSMIPWIFRHVHGYEVSGSLSDWGIHCGIWAVNRTGLLSFLEHWTGRTGGSKIPWWPEATVTIYYLIYIYIHTLYFDICIYIYIYTL